MSLSMSVSVYLSSGALFPRDAMDDLWGMPVICVVGFEMRHELIGSGVEFVSIVSLSLLLTR